MKIRTDFVTNSSSSSFVMAFRDKDEAIKEIEEAFSQLSLECDQNEMEMGDSSYRVNGAAYDLEQAFNHMLNCIETENRHVLSKNDIAELFREEVKWEERFDYEDELRFVNGWTYKELNTYKVEREKEFEKNVTQRTNDKVNRLLSEIQDKEYFMEFEIDDHDDFDMRIGDIIYQIWERDKQRIGNECVIAHYDHH